MREKYLSFWPHSLENSKKLEFYKAFKDKFSTTDYLYQLRHYIMTNERILLNLK